MADGEVISRNQFYISFYFLHCLVLIVSMGLRKSIIYLLYEHKKIML